MTSVFLESFLLLGLITGIVILVLIGIYLFFGYLKEPYREEPLKSKPYTGGKELTGRTTVFKTMFFQFAIYFLIFDVIAFITALAAFNPGWQLLDKNGINLHSLNILLYLSIVLFLYIILPKQESDIL